MQIVINGETREVPDSISITALLQHLEVDVATVVVQRNDEIVARNDFPKIVLSASDSLELVRFVGGG